MIMHIVMWKILEQDKIKNTYKIKKLLMELPPLIKEINHMEVGKDVNVGNDNYDIVMISEFKTMEDMLKYQEHPAHKKVSDFILTIRLERTCVDYKI